MVNATIVPLDQIPKESYLQLYKEKKDAALAGALNYIKASSEDLVIRELKPSDLGVNAGEWTFNIQGPGEQTIVDVTLDDKTYIMIFEVFNLSPNPVVTEIKFGTPSGVEEDIYLEELYMYEHPAGVLTDRIEMKPGARYVIKVVAKGANASEKLGFKGFVVEPKGRNVG